MKTKILAIVFMLCLLCGCKTEVKQPPQSREFWDKFVVVEIRENVDYGTLYTMYDKDTKVMYFYSNGYERAWMSPIYNSDGTVMIYEGGGRK